MACESNIDFGIFRRTDLCQSNNRDINCNGIKRVIVAMKYFQSVNTKSNFYEEFLNFTQNIYTNILNDKIHLVQYHGEQIQQIKQQMLQKYKLCICEVEKCHYIDRHQSYNERKTNGNENKMNIDPMFLFMQNVCDSLHFYLYHLFDLGLRFRHNDNENVTVDEEKDIGEQLKRKRHNLNRKYALKNADKFLIQTEEQSIVFLDDLLSFTLKYDVGTLRSYLMDEEYDSEAVRDDVEQYAKDDAMTTSNIYQQIQNMQFITSIRKYMRHYKLKQMSFSTGFAFFYWPYYSRNKPTEDVIWANDNDYAGHSVADLYVGAPKFKDFQTEILNYSEFDGKFTMYTYKNQTMMKANKYMDTEQIKSMMSSNCHLSRKRILHYEIEANSPITIQHIMAVLIYCDYSGLCTAFSATFRCEHPLEQVNEIKQRNKVFFFLSKYLREAVELYGSCRGHWDGQKEQYLLDNPGPFYCGMSVVLIMPAFIIRLNGPTSTTKQPEIAKNFAQRSGIVIQLNNKYVAGGYAQPFFDSSWLSNYCQEDERITMGGCFPLQIESIRHVATSTNFAAHFGPLFRLDAIISGSHLADFKWNKRQISRLKSIINQISAPIASKKSKFDKYISDTVAFYLNNKQTLTFNLPLIDEYIPEQVKDAIFVSINGERDRNNIVYVDNASNVNIPRPEILNMFGNVKKLVIYSTDERGETTYQISIKYLLSQLQINISNDVKCVIAAKWKDRKGNKQERRSWLFYQDMSASIPKDFISSLKTSIDYAKTYNDLLTIQSPQ